MSTGDATGDLAATAVGLLISRGLTIATAESLTGGLVAGALTTVPGVSAVFRGGIVAYAADLKHSLLGVDAVILDRYGTVHAQVALEMARGARKQLGAMVAVATTGVAGPDPADGHPAGTVHIAVNTPDREVHEALALHGDRARIRQGTVECVLKLLLRTLMEDNH